MATEQLGIDAIVNLAVDAIETGRQIGPAVADGIQLEDTFVLINNFPRLQNVARNAKAALAELKDLTGAEAEQAAMEIAVRAHLDNDPSKVLNTAGKALRLVARTYRHVEATVELVADWKELLAKQAAA